jgi:hypothetical protein
MLTVGFTPLAVGNKLPSATNKSITSYVSPGITRTDAVKDILNTPPAVGDFLEHLVKK